MPTLFTALRAQHRDKPHRARIPEITPEASEEVQKAPLLRGDLNRLLSTQAALFQPASTEAPAPMGVSRAKELLSIAPKRKIAVVGAGLSGLAAAYELDGLGYEVCVSRPGHASAGGLSPFSLSQTERQSRAAAN